MLHGKGWGGRRIASLIIAKIILHPSSGVEVVDLSGGEALEPRMVKGGPRPAQRLLPGAAGQ